MKLNSALSKLTLGVALAAASFAVPTASAAGNRFQGDRVAVESGKSFEDVSNAIKTLVAQNAIW